MTEPCKTMVDPPHADLIALYRAGARAEPTAALDMRILAAAHAAVDHRTARPRQLRPWWKSWLAPVSLATMAVLGLTLALNVGDEQEGAYRAETAAEPPSSPAMEAARSDRSAELHKAETAAKQSAPKPTPDVPHAPQPMHKAKTAAPKPEPKAAAARVEEARPMADSVEPVLSPSPAPPAPATEAAPALPSAMDRPANPTLDPKARRIQSGQSSGNRIPYFPTPEAWLQEIRELRAAGLADEAAQRLELFRQRYPDYALPDDLKTP